jgi:hypothetical protein
MKADVPEKMGPTLPVLISLFVGGFLLRIQDDSKVRSTETTQESISLGSGLISKPEGISCGRWE